MKDLTISQRIVLNKLAQTGNAIWSESRKSYVWLTDIVNDPDLALELWQEDVMRRSYNQ